MQRYREQLKHRLCELQEQRKTATGKTKQAIGQEMHEIETQIGQTTDQAVRFRHVFYQTARQDDPGRQAAARPYRDVDDRNDGHGARSGRSTCSGRHRHDPGRDPQARCREDR